MSANRVDKNTNSAGLTCAGCGWPPGWCRCQQKITAPEQSVISVLSNPLRVSGAGSGMLPRHCPKCGHAVSLVARVRSLSDDPGWPFYGTKDTRRMVCRGDGYRHFIVSVGGVQSHRLAIVESEA